MKEKLIFNWSGGKDSALALYQILQSDQYEILCLLTSISETYQRVSMHGVRLELLEAQTERLGMPLVKLPMPERADMETYNQLMKEKLLNLKTKGATASVFGDIFLEDLRRYREDKLAELDIKAIFPLWNLPTRRLVHEFLALGFKAIVTCVDERWLDKSFAGRIIDESFLNDLPPAVDPCGENGEFHSFVFDAPYFSQPIDFEKGEIVHRKYSVENSGSALDGGFWYCDLLPVKQESPA
ncbi:MAG TPA: diphthine--ammonia ligase [Puia sp.]|nr:diphthine--ammonia ligase [Puia sp.]